MIETLKSVFIAFAVLCLPVSVQADPADQNYWIDRYLSVCYPLKSIKVNSPYGARKDPFTGRRTVHSGLDLQAYYEDVYAMFDGKVVTVGSDSHSGHYVILRHGEYTVSFCHLSKILVRKDDEVFAGDVVGVSGSTGRSTGPHLHLTCRYKGETTDPYTLLVYVKEVRAEAVQALGGRGTDLALHDCKGFLERYATAAMEQQQRYGIPASVTLAQMALESEWGQSTLARRGNNYFGIKCSPQWLAEGRPYSLHDDDRPNERFCNYANVEESIEHHSRLLMGSRYKRCHAFGPTDYHHWLVGLKSAGYATAKDYVRNCEKIIRRYKLYLYDALAQKG